MHDLKANKKKKPVEEHIEDVVEDRTVEEENTSNEYYSNSSTETTIELKDYKHLLNEPSERFSVFPPSFDNILEAEEGGEEEETLNSKSGIIEVLSEQTDISDESAWEKDLPQPEEKEEPFVEEFIEDSLEPIVDTKYEPEEVGFEQAIGETEEMEEEEEDEEEFLESEDQEEWAREKKIMQFQNDLEEVLNYEFPDDIMEEEEMKLQIYENMLKELEKEDKEIDVMLKELEKNKKTIKLIEKTLGPLITHYEKEVCAFQKVGADCFAEIEGEEEEEDVEDEQRTRAAEMAQEILEAEEIESVGSLGKESSGDDLSNMLSQMAAELKESEPEVEKEQQAGQRKSPAKHKRKGALSRRSSKSKPVEGKKKKK